VAVIAVSTIIVTYFHYGIAGHHKVIHLSHYYAFYLIVIYAAYRFNIRGGLAVSVILTILYSPAAYLHLLRLDFSHYIVPSMVEVSMVYAVALVAGYFSVKLKNEKKKVEQVSGEMLEMERQIAHDDRLRVLGQLSAGIAHEIRNPLAAIKSGISIIKSGKGTDQVTDILAAEIDNLNSFVNRFLTYARLGTGAKEPVSFSLFMQELSELIKLAAAGEKVQMKINYDKDDNSLIYIDKNTIKQALLNITINAIEAVRSLPSPKVELCGQTAGDDVFFTVTDNGKGIPDNVIERIFEPFFTTKDDGTGLGLALAAKTASEHGGFVEAQNSDGTKFILKIKRGGK
jgi:signal transduction histidine kinase